MERLPARALRGLTRRLRFSLTTLLTLVAVAAFVSAHIGNRVHAVQGSIESVVKARGHVMVAGPDDWWHRLGVGDYSDRIYAVSFITWRRDRSGTLEHRDALVAPWKIEADWPSDWELFNLLAPVPGAGPEASDANDMDLNQLAAVGPDLLFLELSSPLVTDVGVANLAKFPNLRIVLLSGSAVTDQGIQALAYLPYLRMIDLSQTAVTDAALQSLGQLPRLTQLNVCGTKVTPDAIRALKHARPNLSVSPDPDESTDLDAPQESMAEALLRAAATREIRTSR
ncbi:MAG TPA: hypothetical protein VGJ26_00670 [Pirellulales bacterium]|jgi:hypothetical protein